MVDTDLCDAWRPEAKQQLFANGRLRFEDIAEAVEFILTRSANVTASRMLVAPAAEAI